MNSVALQDHRGVLPSASRDPSPASARIYPSMATGRGQQGHPDNGSNGSQNDVHFQPNSYQGGGGFDGYI